MPPEHHPCGGHITMPRVIRAPRDLVQAAFERLQASCALGVQTFPSHSAPNRRQESRQVDHRPSAAWRPVPPVLAVFEWIRELLPLPCARESLPRHPARLAWVWCRSVPLFANDGREVVQYRCTWHKEHWGSSSPKNASSPGPRVWRPTFHPDRP
jgi:hypothetical protein